MILRCTAKLAKFLGARVTQRPADDLVAEWYANLVWFDRRKCLLMANAETLFPIFVANVRKAAVTPFAPYITRLIESQLESERLPRDLFGPLDADAVTFAPTASKSVLACMNQMVIRLSYELYDCGGIDEADADYLNHELRRELHRGPNFIRPIDEARRLAAARAV